MRHVRLYPRIVTLTVLALALVCLCAATWAMTLQEEIDLGRKLDAEILKKTPLSKDDAAIKQMDQWGQKLIKNVRRPQIAYHFRVLEDDDVNAFAIPGGYVYFTEKLWRMLANDERIGVLSHEIIHVDRRHAIDAMSKQQRRQLWLTAILLGLGASQTTANIASLAESMYTLKYSRGDERQADEAGLELTEKAGYNPAGLLLAMRKIKRMEDEKGRKTPKIFSSHPPTRERLEYLEELLRKRGLPVPGEQVRNVANPYEIGTVTAVGSGTVDFTSTKPLQPGAVVWLMANGWDARYENKTAMPAARAVVTSAGSTNKARFTAIPSQSGSIKKGIGVYDPPAPRSVGGIGSLEPIAGSAALGKLVTTKPVSRFDRLLAVQAVWNDDRTALINDNVGYLVIRDPGNPTGYVAVQRSKHSYAPLGDGAVLVRMNDADQGRWAGPIVSIGRSGQTIEVMPVGQIEPGKTYEVLYPAWGGPDVYAKRVVGTATLKSTQGKIVLKMTGYTGGWGIESIQNGFDVYEKAGAGEAK